MQDNKGYEVDDAKKAETEDKEEDKDIAKEKETGRSEQGYIKDDAIKAEKHDDEEDKDYSKYDIMESLENQGWDGKYGDLLYKILTHPESKDYDSILNDARLEPWKKHDTLDLKPSNKEILKEPKDDKKDNKEDDKYDLTKRKDITRY